MKGYLEKVPQRVGMSWRYKKIVENSKSYGGTDMKSTR